MGPPTLPLLLLGLLGGAGAAGGGPKPYEGAPIGAPFEQYVLALYFQPAWSQGDCNSTVTAKLNGSAAARALSVHGLWPNFSPVSKHGNYSWPQFCKNATYDFTDCDPAVNKTTPAPEFCDMSSGVATRMARVWAERYPSHRWGGLAAHEWAKHGSCTGSDQLAYFQLVDDLVSPLAGGAGGALVSASVGENVSFARLSAAFAADAGQHAAALGCTPDCALSDVWLNYDIAAKAFVDASDASSCAACRAGVHVIDFATEGCK